MPAERKVERFNGFLEWLDSNYFNVALHNFIVNNGVTGFFKNKVILKEPPMEIPQGMKLLKAFKFFEKDKESLVDIQNRASMVIQEEKITGRLCLSVHPLDFLSMSENNYNWRSCHALDGDYRAGNISYMLDHSTVVCYLKTEGPDVKLPRFPENVPWNNKKWRCLLHFSDTKSMMFAGKGYPFVSLELLNLARQMVIDTEIIRTKHPFGAIKLTEWSDEYIDHFKDTKLNSKYLIDDVLNLRSLDGIIEDADGSCQYNDVLHSSCYTPYYSYLKFGLNAPCMHDHFTIGAPTYCLNCGEEVIDQGEGLMLCYHCNETYDYNKIYKDKFIICKSCYSMVAKESSVIVGGLPMCNHCAENLAERCSKCGELYNKKHMNFIKDDSNKKIIWTCRKCSNKEEEK